MQIKSIKNYTLTIDGNVFFDIYLPSHNLNAFVRTSITINLFSCNFYILQTYRETLNKQPVEVYFVSTLNKKNVIVRECNLLNLIIKPFRDCITHTKTYHQPCTSVFPSYTWKYFYFYEYFCRGNVECTAYFRYFRYFGFK